MLFIPERGQPKIIDHLTSNAEAVIWATMGSGKTGSTLYAASTLLADLAIQSMLIVAPKRVATLTWPMEIEKFDNFSHLRYLVLRKDKDFKEMLKNNHEVYCINYELLPNLKKYLTSKHYKNHIGLVVFDELSKAKNHKSKRISSIRGLAHSIPRRWGLTGTPAAKDYLGLFGQYWLIDRGARLSTSYFQFRSTYFKPIDFNQYVWVAKEGAKERIQSKIADITCVVDSADYGGEYIIEQHDIDVNLPKAVMGKYEELEKEFLLELETNTVVAANAAVLSGKLLQFTSGSIYTDEENYEVIHSEKAKAVKNLLPSLGNCLIVYRYKHELAELKKALPEAEVFLEYKDSKEVLIKWNEGRIKALLVHPLSMSHGLNMQFGGSDIIWVSPTYSLEDYDQLNARLARRGQENSTKVYRIIANNTIDEPIYETLKYRDKNQKTLIDAIKRYVTYKT